MKKHIFILSLTITTVLLSSTIAFAITTQEAADQLNAKGLFQGTEKGYELDREMTRAEAITMFVKILGKNDEAQKGTWDTPFTDVEDWAKPYVGYAYTNGLTSGVSATKFGSDEPVSYSQYLTFVLRALDYEVGKDFQWDKAYELSNEIGLTKGVGENSEFLRGDAAVVSIGTVEKVEKREGSTEGDSTEGYEVVNNFEKEKLVTEIDETMVYGSYTLNVYEPIEKVSSGIYETYGNKLDSCVNGVIATGGHSLINLQSVKKALLNQDMQNYFELEQKDIYTYRDVEYVRAVDIVNLLAKYYGHEGGDYIHLFFDFDKNIAGFQLYK